MPKPCYPQIVQKYKNQAQQGGGGVLLLLIRQRGCGWSVNESEQSVRFENKSIAKGMPNKKHNSVCTGYKITSRFVGFNNFYKIFCTG